MCSPPRPPPAAWRSASEKFGPHSSKGYGLGLDIALAVALFIKNPGGEETQLGPMPGIDDPAPRAPVEMRLIDRTEHRSGKDGSAIATAGTT